MKKIATLLGLTNLVMHNSNILGTGKNFAKLDEDQLAIIENALGTEPDADATEKINGLNVKIGTLESTISTLNEKTVSVDDAVSAALEMNGLKLEEGQTPADAIALLGTKCKEYGSNPTTHTIPGTNGKDKSDAGDGLIDGYLDPKDEHNKHLL